MSSSRNNDNSCLSSLLHQSYDYLLRVKFTKSDRTSLVNTGIRYPLHTVYVKLQMFLLGSVSWAELSKSRVYPSTALLPRDVSSQFVHKQHETTYMERELNCQPTANSHQGITPQAAIPYKKLCSKCRQII